MVFIQPQTGKAFFRRANVIVIVQMFRINIRFTTRINMRGKHKRKVNLFNNIERSLEVLCSLLSPVKLSLYKAQRTRRRKNYDKHDEPFSRKQACM